MGFVLRKKKHRIKALSFEDVLESIRKDSGIPIELVEKLWRFAEDPEVDRLFAECLERCRDDDVCLSRCLDEKGVWRIASEKYGINFISTE